MVQSLQMQLLGQQVLLSEHLTEVKESITPKEEDKKKDEKVKRVSPPVLPGGINGHVHTYSRQLQTPHAATAGAGLRTPDAGNGGQTAHAGNGR